MRTFKLYYTSDTHGAIFPSSMGGMMQCIDNFKKDGNTLILDGGDTIQGSPLTNYLWENDQFEAVVPEVFNYGGYDYYLPGNHDFNYGYEGLSKFVNSMKAGCIAANIIDETGKLPIKPYVIHTLENGLRIGITGIVTDCVNLWESKENLVNLKVTDSYEAVKNALEAMKGDCDFTICIYHGGYESDLVTGETLMEGKENLAYQICKELDFNLLLTAHQHMRTEGIDLFGTYTLQLPPNASNYADVTVTETESGFTFESQLVAPGPSYSTELMNQLSEIKSKVDAYLAVPIGSLSEPVEAVGLLERAIAGAKLADLSNAVELRETGAEIACTGLSNNVLGLGSIVTLNDVLKAFPFANEIVVMEISGDILKLALERCASYFERIDGKITISDRFTKPKEEHYNYDFYAGVSYKIDLSQPVGNRVSDVLVNGEPLSDRKYKVAMSSYRSTGTGGYEFFRNCEIVDMAKLDIQQAIVAYLKENPNLSIPKLGEIEFI